MKETEEKNRKFKMKEVNLKKHIGSLKGIKLLFSNIFLICLALSEAQSSVSLNSNPLKSKHVVPLPQDVELYVYVVCVFCFFV